MDFPIVDPDNDDYESLQWDIVFCNVHESDFGEKVHLSSPFQAKDVIKDLDWEATHRTWDEDAEMWAIDLDAVGRAAVHLDGAEYSIAATKSVGEALDE
jgi:hypothetical protein